MLEILFCLYLLIGIWVHVYDFIRSYAYWRGETISFILLMLVVFMFLWPLAVWDYIRCALHKRKGGIRG